MSGVDRALRGVIDCRVLTPRARLYALAEPGSQIKRETKRAIYLDELALFGPSKHPAAAQAPKPAPVAISSAAVPIAAPPAYHAASQTPGVFAEEDAAVAGDNDQSSVRPWSGTSRVVAPG